MSIAINYLYEFGAFRLDADERVLRRLDDNTIVPLTPKVFSTLLLLVENQGRIVSKEAMMSALWADTFVEESNLTFNIRKLRQALGDDAHDCRYVETVSRRGYRFKAEVKKVLTEVADEKKSEIGYRAFVENGNAVSAWSEETASANVSNAPRYETTSSKEHVAVATAVEANTLDGSLRNRTENRSRTERRNRLIAAALVATALLLSAGAATWKYAVANRNGDGLLSAFAHGAGAPPVLQYEQLTLNGSTREAAISPDGEYIAYTQESNGQRSLWLRRLATSENLQLVPPADVEYNQSTFSRDGTYIFYVITEPGNLKAIYRVSTFGGAPIRLIRGIKGTFALSPDERQIVFPRRNMSTGEETLFVANLDGTGERELLKRGRPERIDYPAWSPDGRTIVCVAGHTETSTPSMSVIEIDVASAAERVLLKPEWFNVGSTQWLPDGRSLLVNVSPRLASTGNQLWLVSYPDGQARRLTEDLNNYSAFSLSRDASRIVAIQTKRSAHVWVSPNERGDDAKQTVEGDELSWTQDGRIVYSSTSGGNRDIWIMRTDGTEQKQLTVNPGYDASPVVTPDDRYIVFSSDRTGVHHLWRMNLDGGNQVQLTNGVGEKFSTAALDSRSIYYSTVDRQTLWRIPLEGGEPVKLIDDYIPYPSVSPDGATVAYFQRAPETNEQIVSVRALDDSQSVRTFKPPPGKWASISLRWDANGRAIIYARQSDGRVRLYRQNLDASAPQQIADFAAEDDFNFSWSPDGKRFAFARGDWQHDAVLIRVSK